MTRARTADGSELDAIADTLTRAFDDDPIWRWLVPHDRQWVKGVPYVFRHATREKAAHGNVWVAADVEAVAVWGAPGEKPSQVRDVLAIPRMATVFRRQSLAGLKFEAAMKKARPKEPHWYLAILGTHPDHQGKGHGSAVLKPVLDVCDRDGIGAYLESSKEANLAYYHRHGFEVVEEMRPVASGPLMWSMWRDPRPEPLTSP